MSIIDNIELPEYNEALAKFSNAVKSGATDEKQSELYAQAMQVMGSEIGQLVENSTSERLEQMFAERAKNQSLTAKEIKFFNEINTEVGSKTDAVLPDETINQVFDDLVTEHPLLAAINFQNTGLRLKALTADTSGSAVWGPIYNEIQGQLDAQFTETPFDQNKLTAFVVIPKDALEFGAAWLKTFVLAQIDEQLSVAVETAIVTGDGDNKPIGLMKDLSTGTVASGKTTYSDKAASVDISATKAEDLASTLAPVLSKLATTENGKTLNISDQVKLLVNPQDYYAIRGKFTVQSSVDGVYHFEMPFGIEIIQSVAVPAGSGVLFVANRYDAYMGGQATINEFDQTLAIEDLQLYTAKSFWYGKARDNNVAEVITVSTTTPSA